VIEGRPRYVGLDASAGEGTGHSRKKRGWRPKKARARSIGEARIPRTHVRQRKIAGRRGKEKRVELGCQSAGWNRSSGEKKPEGPARKGNRRRKRAKWHRVLLGGKGRRGPDSPPLRKGRRKREERSPTRGATDGSQGEVFLKSSDLRLTRFQKSLFSSKEGPPSGNPSSSP